MNCFCIVLYFVLLPFCIGNLTSLGFQKSVRDVDCCKGYHRIDGECIPYCKDGCPKPQVCQEPNVCGFKSQKYLSMQRLKCSEFMHEAKCNPSHIFSNGKCIPYCDQNCTNGFCDSPGVCKCYPDYKENPKTKTCERKFDVNESLRNFSSLTTLQISTTDPNFTTSTTDVNSNCQNDCTDGICINGLCNKRQTQDSTTIIKITTTSNKELTNSTTNLNNCQNGVCNQDRKCQCKMRFILKNDFEYVPPCDGKCGLNSICVAPTYCEYIEGDISKLDISSAVECFPTYKDVNDKEGCLNGTCVAFNKCDCLGGYFPKPSGDKFECIAIISTIATRTSIPKWVFVILPFLILIIIIIIVLSVRYFAHRSVRRFHNNVVYEFEN